MWKKFKELRLIFKIIVGIIAFIFFPVTLLLFAIELFIKSIKNKKIAGGIISGILSIILLFFSSIYVSAIYEVATTDTTQVALEEKEKAEQARIEQEAKEKEAAEQKAKEEEDKKKAEEEQKTKEQEAKKKAEEEQAAKELAKKEAEEKVKKDDEQKTAEIKNTTTKNDSNYNDNDNNNSSTVVYVNGGSSKSNKYHSSADAHNMEGAVKMTLKNAESQGYVACKRCY